MATTNFAELLAPIYARLKQIKMLTEPFGGHIDSQTFDNIENVCLSLPEEETGNAIKAILTAIDKVEEIITAVTDDGYMALMDKTVLYEATQALIFLTTGGTNLPVDDDKTKKTLDLISAGYADELQSCKRMLIGYVEEIQKYSKDKPGYKDQKPNTPCIESPIDFKVAAFKDFFDPIFTVNEAALFLYFLQILGFIPNYAANSLGTLAKPLFALSQQTVKEAISDITERNDIKHADLILLKNHLLEILVLVDSNLKRDIKPTPKKKV